jgi:hypothetical protein
MSVDYDPIKAHEYYEKHKKLKGRKKKAQQYVPTVKRTKKGWNHTQKEQLDYAKAQLKNNLKKQLKKIEEDKQKQKEAAIKNAKRQIELIRVRLKYMSPEEREKMTGKINKAIDGIRQAKEAALSNLASGTKQAKKQARADYEKGIDEAYKKIGKK